MDRYVEFLQDKHTSESFWQLWQGASDAYLPNASSGHWPLIRLGTSDFEVFQTRRALSELGGLDGLLKRWLARFRPDKKSNQKWIKEISAQWKRERKFKTTREIT